ncbi:MAG: PhoH family protein [Candidatus Sumerlaeia bacterium]|nr:PhoH family protein [Candidatus Sumerlaeia bacterium]
MSSNVEQRIVLAPEEILDLCGVNDAQLRRLESEFSTRIVARGNELRVRGAEEAVSKTGHAIEQLLTLRRREGRRADRREVRQTIQTIKEHPRPEADRRLKSMRLEKIDLPLKRRNVAPLTEGQRRYVEAMQRCDIVFGIGPAGTGKTYLAMAMAVSALVAGEVSRIILVRPAVEAGERLGFLPGDLAAKIDPYLRPLYDALYEMLDAEKIRSHIESGVIEVAPLAFMRGRTLNSAFVILDEGQNTTHEQMKMFLTRLGFDSKAVITGDVTQIDLPSPAHSGLVRVQRILAGIEGIEFIHFGQSDVVRHDLVQRIIRAYEQSGEPAAPAPGGQA